MRKTLIGLGTIAAFFFAAPVLAPQGTIVAKVVAPAAEACGFPGCERYQRPRVVKRYYRERAVYRQRPVYRAPVVYRPAVQRTEVPVARQLEDGPCIGVCKQVGTICPPSFHLVDAPASLSASGFMCIPTRNVAADTGK